MKIYYIAGKVTGLDQEAVRRKFTKAEVELRNLGYLVVNPVELILERNNSGEPLESWQEEMDYLSPYVEKCDGVYMLTDWETSKGATIEYTQAKVLGKVVKFQGKGMTMENIQNAILATTDISWRTIIRKNRKREFALTRQVFAYLCMHNGVATCTEVAKILGRDHTTVLHSRNTIRGRLEVSDPMTVRFVNSVLENM